MQNRKSSPQSSGIVDSHVHVWTADTAKYPLAPGYTREQMDPLSFTPQQLFVHTRGVGITRIVLIQMSYYGSDNSYMTDVMRTYPNTFGGVGIVDENDEPCQNMLRLAARGVRGFRIVGGKPQRWLDSPGMAAMWKCGAENGLAMCPLMGVGDLEALEKLCTRSPRTPVVIDHCARIGTSGRIRKRDVDALCALARFKQVMVKISAFYALSRAPRTYLDLAPMIRRLLDSYGPERLMWASDGPFQMMGGHNVKESVELIRSGLDYLTAEDRDWLLRRTASKVFFE